MPFSRPLLPLSALQHILFCERQTALIHLEQLWAENRFTAEGRVIHKKADSAIHESRPGIRVARSLPVSSEKLGISGVCDIVEFTSRRVGVPPGQQSAIPIEYKRGKPKAHRADEVQVCAQALCLEEMLSIEIPQAFLFYGKRKRRTPVSLDDQLRQLTIDTAARLHDLIASGISPPASYESRKCDSCSLIEHCQPQAFRLKRGVASWFTSQLTENPVTSESIDEPF